MPDLGSPPGHLGSLLNFGIPPRTFGIPPGQIWDPLQILGSPGTGFGIPYFSRNQPLDFGSPPGTNFGIPPFFDGFQTLPRDAPGQVLGSLPKFWDPLKFGIRTMKFFACGAKIALYKSLYVPFFRLRRKIALHSSLYVLKKSPAALNCYL